MDNLTLTVGPHRMPHTGQRTLVFEAQDLGAVERWVRAQPSYASIAFVSRPATQFRETYLDTEHGALFSAGYALSIQEQGDASIVHLNAEHTVKRQPEQTEPLADFKGENAKKSDISAKVELITGAAPLGTVLQTETFRNCFVIQQDGAPVASLDLDSIDVTVPGGNAFTLARAAITCVDEDGLDRIQRLVAAMASAGGLTPTNDSVVAAASRTTGVSPVATFDFGHAELYADATTGEYAYASLRREFTAFLSHEPGTRLGEDPEELHDMRVAARRMRAILGVFRPVLPLRFGGLRDEVKWISGVLGEVRDQDVRLEWLTTVQAQATWEEAVPVGPLIQVALDARTGARSRMLDALAGDRYKTLVATMGAALRAGEVTGPDARTPVTAFAARKVRKRYRRFEDLARELREDSPVAAYHAARIAGKRLRYSLECFEAVLPTRARSLIRATKRAQEDLGEHQDCSVTVRWLLDTANAKGTDLPPATLMRMGELLAQQRARMAEIRMHWPRSHDEIKKGWRALRKSMQADQEPPDGEAPPGHDKPIQRPFRLFQRLFRQRPRRRS
jgi:CHAD domain-containing protein